MNKIIIVALVVFGYKSILSQSFPWVKNAIGTSSATAGDEGYSVSTDASGNVYIAGAIGSSTIAFGTYTLSKNGSYDLFLAKYDPSGNILWARSAGGIGDDRAMAISSDATGNVYIIGSYYSTMMVIGTNTLINSDATGNTSDIFIAKYDPSGNVVWVKSIGGVKMDEGYSCITDAAGNIYFTGNFSSTSVSFGTYTLSNVAGWSDIYLVKYNPSGNVIWARSYGNSSTEGGQAVNSNASGQLVITGFYRSANLTFGTYTITNSNSSLTTGDVFIVKLDSSGNVLWANTAGGSTSDDLGFAAALDPTGNVFVTGYFRSNVFSAGTFSFTNAGSSNSQDIFISKYNTSGVVAWAKSAGSAGTDIGWGVTTDISGNCYATGGFNSGSSISFGSSTLTSIPANCNPLPSCDPAYIITLNPAGIEVCVTVLSSGGDDWFGITADASGNIFLAGDYISNPFSIGTYTLTRSALEDIFVAKYVCNSVGLSSPENKNDQVILFPNPVCDILNLDINTTSGYLRIFIEDVSGRVLRQITSNKNKLSIDINDLAPGLYLLKVNGNERMEKRFVKE